jgi:hypothetical protein
MMKTQTPKLLVTGPDGNVSWKVKAEGVAFPSFLLWNLNRSLKPHTLTPPRHSRDCRHPPNSPHIQVGPSHLKKIFLLCVHPPDGQVGVASYSGLGYLVCTQFPGGAQFWAGGANPDS